MDQEPAVADVRIHEGYDRVKVRAHDRNVALCAVEVHMMFDASWSWELGMLQRPAKG